MKADSFGHWLKQRRRSLDLTQHELARRAACAVSTLEKIEAGQRRPSSQMAQALAKALGIPADKYLAFVDFARGHNPAIAGRLFRGQNNLPAPTTPLIGRDQIVADLCQRLSRDDTRLVSLIGPPGIGKTRLALQVASQVGDSFADGVFLVELASVSDPDLVLPAILLALRLVDYASGNPFDRLCSYLSEKTVLLVLDNFEQVVAAAPLIARLLLCCPFLKILVTSRVALRLRAERQFPVPPLRLPDLEQYPPLQALQDYSAIALFVDRAQAVAPDFTLTQTNALDVAHICCYLDGIPLAIELVAARIKILSPGDLLLRLGGKLLLQTDGLRDLEDRQRTLGNAVEWSVRLLSPGEQALFCCLAVFVGGWTLAAAEQVCACAVEPEGALTLNRSSLSICDLLNSLVNKSLVVSLATEDGMRFRMLEIIRRFALEQLQASSFERVVRHSHAKYFLLLLEQAQPDLYKSSALINRLDEDYDNLIAALEWATEQDQIETLVNLSLAMLPLWAVHGRHLSEGRRWLGRVLEQLSEAGAPDSMLAQLLEEAGILAYLQSDFSAARPLLEQALKSAYKTRERLLVAHIQHSLSNVLMNLGEFERVASLLAECLVSARAEQDKWLIAMALNNLAEVVRLRGDYDQAEAMFEEGLALLTELDNKAFIPILMDGLGTIAQYKGQFERALELHQTCLQLACEMDHQRVLALALEKLAGVAGSAGRAAQAARLLGAAEQLRESIGVPVETIDRADRDHYVSLARSGLTPYAFGEAWAQGRALPLEQAIAETLDLRSLSWGKTDPSRREC